jgi:hypothetical protein
MVSMISTCRFDFNLIDGLKRLFHQLMTAPCTDPQNLSGRPDFHVVGDIRSDRKRICCGAIRASVPPLTFASPQFRCPMQIQFTV